MLACSARHTSVVRAYRNALASGKCSDYRGAPPPKRHRRTGPVRANTADDRGRELRSRVTGVKRGRGACKRRRAVERRNTEPCSRRRYITGSRHLGQRRRTACGTIHWREAPVDVNRRRCPLFAYGKVRGDPSRHHEACRVGPLTVARQTIPLTARSR
jgi:hypothetical protein